jgi:hypothetical protein
MLGTMVSVGRGHWKRRRMGIWIPVFVSPYAFLLGGAGFACNVCSISVYQRPLDAIALHSTKMTRS